MGLPPFKLKSQRVVSALLTLWLSPPGLLWLLQCLYPEALPELIWLWCPVPWPSPVVHTVPLHRWDNAACLSLFFQELSAYRQSRAESVSLVSHVPNLILHSSFSKPASSFVVVSNTVSP